jgi:hypothetical protein
MYHFGRMLDIRGELPDDSQRRHPADSVSTSLLHPPLPALQSPIALPIFSSERPLIRGVKACPPYRATAQSCVVAARGEWMQIPSSLSSQSYPSEALPNRRQERRHRSLGFSEASTTGRAAQL